MKTLFLLLFWLGFSQSQFKASDLYIPRWCGKTIEESLLSKFDKNQNKFSVEIYITV